VGVGYACNVRAKTLRLLTFIPGGSSARAVHPSGRMSSSRVSRNPRAREAGVASVVAPSPTSSSVSFPGSVGGSLSSTPFDCSGSTQTSTSSPSSLMTSGHDPPSGITTTTSSSSGEGRTRRVPFALGGRRGWTVDRRRRGCFFFFGAEAEAEVEAERESLSLPPSVVGATMDTGGGGV
jgi:hypothetical protein